MILACLLAAAAAASLTFDGVAMGDDVNKIVAAHPGRATLTALGPAWSWRRDGGGTMLVAGDAKGKVAIVDFSADESKGRKHLVARRRTVRHSKHARRSLARARHEPRYRMRDQLCRRLLRRVSVVRRHRNGRPGRKQRRSTAPRDLGNAGTAFALALTAGVDVNYAKFASHVPIRSETPLRTHRSRGALRGFARATPWPRREQARLAGMLHDLARLFPGPRLIAECELRAMPISAFERENPVVLHARLGALIAQEAFGIHDPDVLSAIKHTVGSAVVSPLDCALYLADGLEDRAELRGPGRLMESRDERPRARDARGSALDAGTLTTQGNPHRTANGRGRAAVWFTSKRLKYPRVDRYRARGRAGQKRRGPDRARRERTDHFGRYVRRHCRAGQLRTRAPSPTPFLKPLRPRAIPHRASRARPTERGFCWTWATSSRTSSRRTNGSFTTSNASGRRSRSGRRRRHEGPRNALRSRTQRVLEAPGSLDFHFHLRLQRGRQQSPSASACSPAANWPGSLERPLGAAGKIVDNVQSLPMRRTCLRTTPPSTPNMS